MTQLCTLKLNTNQNIIQQISEKNNHLVNSSHFAQGYSGVTNQENDAYFTLSMDPTTLLH